jgi:hypothetical protein
MRRLHLIELHEQEWIPRAWGELFQKTLGQLLSKGKLFEAVADCLQHSLRKLQTDAVLDLCSGSGDLAVNIWRGLDKASAEDEIPRLVLSDLFPNLAAYREHKKEHGELVEFYSEPINALHPPEGGPRVWMMIQSLHHFRPEEARSILQNAARNADGFIVLETTQRTFKNFMIGFLGFFGTILVAFRIRPWRFRNLLWGFLVPVVPMMMSIDGIVSVLRSYTLDELDEFTQSVGESDFSWERGYVPVPGTPLKITYLVGWRSKSGVD